MASTLPQIIPEGRCLQCDVCCRFTDADSPMRPYFMKAEIDAAIARGLSAEHFPDRSGGRVSVVPHPIGEGFICPAFDVSTNRCAIYVDRPLDCRLYPYVVMRPPEGGPPLLGWDQLCPYLREEADPLLPLITAPVIAEWLCPIDEPSVLSHDPGLAGPCQESAWMLEPLSPLGPFQWPQNDGVETSVPSPLPSDARLIPFRGGRDEYEQLRRYLHDAVETPLSLGHPAALLMWQPLMRFFWLQWEGGTALLARQASVYFAPVPPRPGPGRDLASTCRHLLALLDRLNSNPEVSRIEWIGDDQRRLLIGPGMVCRSEGKDYLYDRRALAELKGDRYKGRRWNCNQAARRFRPSCETFRTDDLTVCLRLYATWRRWKERRGRADNYAAALLADGFYAHWQALAHADDWGLAVRVARVEGRIRAYTVGAPLDERTMLVLHEIADPACSGLGPWLFREWCREWERYELVNVMDDSGLEAVRRVKRRDQPLRTVPTYRAARPSMVDGNGRGPQDSRQNSEGGDTRR
jgi:Fe-S-cluster containining protein